MKTLAQALQAKGLDPNPPCRKTRPSTACHRSFPELKNVQTFLLRSIQTVEVNEELEFSSPDLTRDYIALFNRLNHLKD